MELYILLAFCILSTVLGIYAALKLKRVNKLPSHEFCNKVTYEEYLVLGFGALLLPAGVVMTIVTSILILIK